MNAIENARCAPTIDVAIRIAYLFCLSVDQLFDLEYEGKPARREEAAAIGAERSGATVEESVAIAHGDEPEEKQAEKEITFERLRNVIGP